MKVAELRKLEANDLIKQADQLKADIVELKRRLHMGELQNVRAVRQKRKDLARTLTILGERLAKESK